MTIFWKFRFIIILLAIQLGPTVGNHARAGIVGTLFENRSRESFPIFRQSTTSVSVVGNVMWRPIDNPSKVDDSSKLIYNTYIRFKLRSCWFVLIALIKAAAPCRIVQWIINQFDNQTERNEMNESIKLGFLKKI